jgi:hypothetical protein
MGTYSYKQVLVVRKLMKIQYEHCLPNLMKTYQSVQKLLVGDTDWQTGDFISLHSFLECRLVTKNAEASLDASKNARSKQRQLALFWAVVPCDHIVDCYQRCVAVTATSLWRRRHYICVKCLLLSTRSHCVTTRPSQSTSSLLWEPQISEGTFMFCL